MSTKFLVEPKLPTVANDLKVLPLLGTDLWLYVSTEYIIVVPGIIDIPNFKDALSRTLSLFPEYAGRLRHNPQSGSWWIELLNCRVPLVVDNNSSAPLPLNDYVVLDSLEPFVENVKLVSWNFDFPLLSFKLSINHALGHSVIGFSVSHIIADGHRGHQFLATLSSMYQGVHPSDPRSYPTPEPPTTQYSPDESQSGASFWNSSRCSPKEAFAKYGRDFKSMSHVRFRISPERMDKLHEIANRNNSTGQALRDQMISRQDAISAYVARLLTCKCEKSAPISFIRNNFNYRANKYVPTNMLGTNSLVIIQTPKLSGKDTDIASIARSIRCSITRAKSADFAREDLVDAHHAMLNAANAGDCFCVLPPQGCLTINGNIAADWSVVHFGYPGRTVFHAKWLGSRYVRTFHSNPQLARDGDGKVYLQDPRTGHLDVQFGVDKDDRETVTSQIAIDMNALDTTNDLPDYTDGISCNVC